MNERIKVFGGCHCGKVRFEAWIKKPSEAQLCNCSICSMCGFQHLIVPSRCFALTSGEEVLREYRFATGTARHLFCGMCGVKSFYVPRSNPDGYSLNIRCIELPQDFEMVFSHYDGRNWELNADSLRHLST